MSTVANLAYRRKAEYASLLFPSILPSPDGEVTAADNNTAKKCVAGLVCPGEDEDEADSRNRCGDDGFEPIPS